MTMCVVTGSAGYIGGAVVAALDAMGADVVCAPRSMEDVPWNEADVVVHAAGARRDSRRDPQVANVLPTELVCARARPTARVVLVSSRAVYGPRRGAGPAGEDARPAPDDAYGRSKRRAEQVVEAMRDDWVAARVAGVWGGPRESRPASGVLDAMVRAAHADGAIGVHPSPVTIDHVHVTEAANVLARLALDRRIGSRGYVNVAGPHVGVGLLASAVANALAARGRSCRLVPKPQPPRFRLLDCARVQRLLDWRPELSLLDGVDGAVAEGLAVLDDA